MSATDAERLAAGLAEDERVAWAIHDVTTCDALLYEEDMGAAASRSPGCDCGRPARARADIAAKRRILAIYELENGTGGGDFESGRVSGLGEALEILATVYRDAEETAT